MAEVFLKPISESEFASWPIQSKNTYRDGIVKNGSTFEEAQKMADDDMSNSLGYEITNLNLEKIL